MGAMAMTIRLDHQMREQILHRTAEFPVTYYHDELAALPNREGPFHWHPDFEIATATVGVLDYQVGQQHVLLQPGDGIFVNGNMLHRVRQLSGEQDDPVPIILFSGAAIAPEYSAIYQKYIQPLAQCAFLPFLVFRHEDAFHSEINALIRDTCRQLIRQEQCYEMAVQRNLSQIFEKIFCNFDRFPRPEEARVEMKSQIRLQKMLSYLYAHYAEPVTLAQIAEAAHISRSEAGRCFQTYMGCSPVDVLIRYRLQMARRLLGEGTLTLQQISEACGFHSANYFSRKFKKVYGHPPSEEMKLRK